MVDRDRPVEGLRPEERLADRLAQERGLTPPFAIEDVAREFADLDEDLIPADCDAVVLGLLRERSRPLIVLNRDRREPRRRRFSVAHEVGHIVIPWHVGTIACHTDLNLTYGDYYYRVGEAEANRFAATLLLPSAWVRQRVEQRTDLEGRLRAVWDTGVSAPAACLRLVRFLEPGWIFVLADGAGCVQLSAASPGTDINALEAGEQLRRELFDSVCSGSETILLGSRPTLWWSFDQQVDLLGREEDRSAAEIREVLLERHFAGEDRDAKRFRIAGIEGSAKSRADATSPEEMYAALLARYAAREDLAAMVQDPEFKTYLSLRAGEMSR